MKTRYSITDLELLPSPGILRPSLRLSGSPGDLPAPGSPAPFSLNPAEGFQRWCLQALGVEVPACRVLNTHSKRTCIPVLFEPLGGRPPTTAAILALN